MLNYEGDHYIEYSMGFAQSKVLRTQEIRSVPMDLGLQVCTHIQAPHTERFPAVGLNSLFNSETELNREVQFSDKTTK